MNHVAIPQAQAFLPAGGTLREPEAVRQRLRADTEKWFEDMNHTLCTGSGDSAYWMHRTEYLTFRAASFAARSLLDVQEARVDDAAARRTAQPRLEQADHDFVAETRRLAKGTGDSGYWMGRVNTMNLAAASHACVAASLCDGAMAAVLRPTIEQALAQADRAFVGSGDANYWCRRASDQARTLEGNSGLATLHEKIVGQPALLADAPDAPDASTPPLPAGTQALREDLERLGSGFTQQLDRLLFGHSLDATGWIMRADYIAFQSAAQAARLALLVADQRTDAPEQEAKGLQEIESAARDFRKSADSYATGCGDSAYWMKRDALLGVEVAKCLARVASACDAPMARAVRPRLEKMLTETTSLGFNGNGDAAYWSGRVKTLGNDLEMLLDDARIAVAGECAARSTEVATAPPAGTETSPAAETRRQAGIDLARHQVVHGEWNTFVQTRETESASLTTTMNDLARQINPLVQQDQKVVPWLNRTRNVMLPGFVGTMVAVNAMSALGSAGPYVAGAAVALTAGAFLANLKLRTRHDRIMEQYQPLDQKYQALDARRHQVDRAVAFGRTNADEATAALEATRGKLEVGRMAEALSPNPPPQDATVDISETVVRIGRLNLPRRQSPDTATDVSV